MALPPEPDTEPGRRALAALLRAQAAHGQAVRDRLAEKARPHPNPRSVAGGEDRVVQAAAAVVIKARLLDLALGLVRA